MIDEQRRRDFVQIGLHLRVFFSLQSPCGQHQGGQFGAQKTQKTFLQDIVGQRFIARGPPKIPAQPRRRLRIERLKCGRVHASGSRRRIGRSFTLCGHIFSGRREFEARAQPHVNSLDPSNSARRNRLAGNSWPAAAPLLREMIRHRCRYEQPSSQRQKENAWDDEPAP